MATMYPKNIDFTNATSSEKKVFKELEKQLPDNYSVFYSVSWVDNVNGSKVQSECDFLIFNEGLGFLTCEVKGGYGYKKEGDNFILEDKEDRILKRSPMQQAEESSRYFYKLYSNEYNETFNGIYGSFCIFPFYSVYDPVLLDHRDKTIVLDINDMSDLGKKIMKVFDFYKARNRQNYYLLSSQKMNFINLINKRIAAQRSAESIIEEKEYELEIVNRVQDNLISFVQHYKKTFFSGGAGTGKTWIAYKFAKKALLEDKRVLVLVTNEHLISMMDKLLSGYKNIFITTFEGLLNKDKISSCDEYEILNEYESKIFDKYDVVIVDEAQDLNQNQAIIISKHLINADSELRVFYDVTQNIFDKDFKDGFGIETPPFILTENLRNTSSIYDWAKENTNLGREVVTNQVIGPIPFSQIYKKEYDMFKYLEYEIVRLIDDENISPESIVILSDHDNYEKILNSRIGRWSCTTLDNIKKDSLTVSLVESFKGLESNIVFYCHNHLTPMNYNYVAYTRAKYYLYDLILKK